MTLKMNRLLASTATLAMGAAFMSDIVPTVLVKGGLRVNEADFKADQAKDKADRQYEPYTGKQDAEQSSTGKGLEMPEDAEITAAPSAPDFTAGDGKPVPIDENKNAAAPTAVPNDTWLKQSKGTGKNKKWFVVDGAGEPVEHPLINEKGYDSENAVQAAIDNTPRVVAGADPTT